MQWKIQIYLYKLFYTLVYKHHGNRKHNNIHYWRSFIVTRMFLLAICFHLLSWLNVGWIGFIGLGRSARLAEDGRQQLCVNLWARTGLPANSISYVRWLWLQRRTGAEEQLGQLGQPFPVSPCFSLRIRADSGDIGTWKQLRTRRNIRFDIRDVFVKKSILTQLDVWNRGWQMRKYTSLKQELLQFEYGCHHLTGENFNTMCHMFLLKIIELKYIQNFYFFNK